MSSSPHDAGGMPSPRDESESPSQSRGVGAPHLHGPLADESPGVPGFRTWRGVYVFVFLMFVLMVIGLAVFSRVYA